MDAKYLAGFLRVLRESGLSSFRLRDDTFELEGKFHGAPDRSDAVDDSPAPDGDGVVNDTVEDEGGDVDRLTLEREIFASQHREAE